MRRLELVSRFFLAMSGTVCLLMGGVAIPPAGVVLIPLVPQPVLSFCFRFGIAWGAGAVAATAALLFFVAGKELVLIYGLFALMTLILFALLGRLRSVELLVLGIALVVFAVTRSEEHTSELQSRFGISYA